MKNKLKRKIELVNKRNEWLNQVVPRLKSYLEENEVKITKGSVHNSDGALYKKYCGKMGQIIREVNDKFDEGIPPSGLDYYLPVTYGQLYLNVRVIQCGIDFTKRQFLASFGDDQKVERIPIYQTKTIDFDPKNLADTAEKINQKDRVIGKLRSDIDDLKMFFPTSIEWEDFYYE